MRKERKLNKTKASFHTSGKSTMGIYVSPDIGERIENRRASLSIVDEGDSDAEIESPAALLQQALGPNGASSSGTSGTFIQGGCKYVDTCTTSDTRTCVASIK